MEIVACLDKGFVMPTGVMMYSVCMNNQDTEIMFHLVVDESVTDADRNDLKRTVESFEGKKVTFYTVNSRNFQEMPALVKGYRITQSAYYRLFLTEILPTNLDKVLYLDGDIIVRHSLLPLWNTDLTNSSLAAVIDYEEETMSFYERLNYPRRYSYFNSGVLLINLKYWREHDVVKVFNSYIEEHRSDIVYHDQDVLNAVFYNKKILLPIKYNTTQNTRMKSLIPGKILSLYIIQRRNLGNTADTPTRLRVLSSNIRVRHAGKTGPKQINAHCHYG